MNASTKNIGTGRSRTIIEFVAPQFLTPNFMIAGLTNLIMWHHQAVTHNRIHIHELKVRCFTIPSMVNM